MVNLPVDDAALQVEAGDSADLPAKVFGLYRQFAKQAEAHANELRSIQAKSDKVQAADRVRLAKLGAEVFHFGRCIASLTDALNAAGLSRELSRLDQMMKRFTLALTDGGIVIESLDGLPVNDELAEIIEVLGAIPGAVDQPRIKETLEPLIKVDGCIVLRPRVITEVPGTNVQ